MAEEVEGVSKIVILNQAMEDTRCLDPCYAVGMVQGTLSITRIKYSKQQKKQAGLRLATLDITQTKLSTLNSTQKQKKQEMQFWGNGIVDYLTLLNDYPANFVSCLLTLIEERRWYPRKKKKTIEKKNGKIEKVKKRKKNRWKRQIN